MLKINKTKELILSPKTLSIVGVISITSILGCNFIAQANAGAPTVEGVCVTATLLSNPSVVKKMGYCETDSSEGEDNGVIPPVETAPPSGEVLPPEETKPPEVIPPSPEITLPPEVTPTPSPEPTKPPVVTPPPVTDFSVLSTRELNVPGVGTANLSWASNDGKKIIATRNTSKDIQISNDFGASWSSKTVGYSTSYLASSHDGKTLIIGTSNRIDVSIDGGNVWEARALPVNMSKIAVSGDGNTLAYSPTGNTNKVYISKDLGKTWAIKQITSSSFQNNIYISYNGSTISVSTSNGFFDISKNGGDTWSAVSPNLGYGGTSVISMSTDTNTIFGVQGSASGFSKDSGKTWKKTGINLRPDGGIDSVTKAVSTSPDGKTLRQVTAKFIYTSTDGGLTWEQVVSPINLAFMTRSDQLESPMFTNADKFYVGEFGEK